MQTLVSHRTKPRTLTGFPTSYDQLKIYADIQGITLAQSGKLFVQYACICAIAHDKFLSEAMILRGTAALRFFYAHRRLPGDLDYIASTSRSAYPTPDEREGWALPIRDALATNIPRLFPALARWSELVYENSKVHVSPNMTLSGVRRVCLAGPVRCSVLITPIEDILADKLAAVLQQERRISNRPQDVFDIAAAVRELGGQLDFLKLREAFRYYLRWHGFTPSVNAYTLSVREKSGEDYESIRESVVGAFIPFNEAWDTLISTVTRLCSD